MIDRVKEFNEGLPAYGGKAKITGKAGRLAEKESKPKDLPMQTSGFCDLHDENGKLLMTAEQRQKKADEVIRDISEELKYCYDKIIDRLKYYCDLQERNYSLIALWIMGTYAHDEFYTYPYLFLNAPKGAGKSRTLNLITTLASNGKMIASLTEAGLFRNAKGRTFGLDEFENIDSKEKNTLRELLNSAYKRGLGIEREKKKKTLDGENWITETFDVYTAIVIANIEGMNDVLKDRCINLILEKSTDRVITKKIERFDDDEIIIEIKKILESASHSFKNLVAGKNWAKDWNDFIDGKLRKTKTNEKISLFFKKVDDLNINGRNLELILPLCYVAYLIDEDSLEKILTISQEIIKEKENEDYYENKDSILLRFLSGKLGGDLEYKSFVSTKEVARQFRAYLGDENPSTSPEWVGKALSRLNLITDKKREAGGIRVLIDLEKARQKAPNLH